MKSGTRSFYAGAVQGAIEHIARALDEAIDLHTLAAGAALSPFHFHRVFRGMVGETPLELSRRLRMERAAWHLLHTDLPVAQVAFDAGYETHEAFTRSFRAAYAESPSSFRQKRYPHVEIAATCGVHFDREGCVPIFVARELGGQTMDVEIKQMPSMRVGAVGHVGPYNQIGEAFARLGQIAGEAGLIGQSGASMIALYYDDPDSTSPDELRSDSAIVVSSDAELPAGLREEHVAGGTYACYLHRGSYAQLGDVWARLLGEWLPASGHELGAGASYEIYLDTMDIPEDDLRTELYIPVA